MFVLVLSIPSVLERVGLHAARSTQYPSRVTLREGDSIDRFTIVEHLGAGGMGDVYRAHDTRLSRDVALKVLRAGVDTGSRAALLREARAAAALEHPNVVGIYDVAEATSPAAMVGTPYMSMEFVSGRSLRSYIGDESIEIERRIGWLRDVALGLAAAHRARLVHRDVKPANVMIGRDGQVKVLDFGIAKLPTSDPSAETQTLTGPSDVPGSTGQVRVVGTPAYMAPEQLLSEPVDGRADQFAWGVTAYELLSGQKPWASVQDAVHLVAEVLSRNPTALSIQNPRVPARVSEVVMRALSKSADKRFRSMDELVTALGFTNGLNTAELQDEGPPGGDRISGSVTKLEAVSLPHASPVRSNWSPLFLALALVAFFGVATFGVFRWTRAPSAPIDTAIVSPSSSLSLSIPASTPPAVQSTVVPTPSLPAVVPTQNHLQKPSARPTAVAAPATSKKTPDGLPIFFK